jgi:hypothetical protein
MKNILPLIIICVFIVGGVLYLKKDSSLVDTTETSHEVAPQIDHDESIRSKVDVFISNNHYDYVAFTTLLQVIEFSPNKDALVNVRESLLLSMCSKAKQVFNSFCNNSSNFDLRIRNKEFKEIMRLCSECDLYAEVKYLDHCRWVLDEQGGAQSDVKDILSRELNSVVIDRFLNEINYQSAIYGPENVEDVKWRLEEKLKGFKVMIDEWEKKYVFYKRENFSLPPSYRFAPDGAKVLDRRDYLNYQFYLDLGDSTIGSRNNPKWP